MDVSKLARKAAAAYSEQLPSFTLKQLGQLASVIKAPRGRWVKGGKWKQYRKAELVKSVRAASFGHTSWDQLLRYAILAADFAGDYEQAAAYDDVLVMRYERRRDELTNLLRR